MADLPAVAPGDGAQDGDENSSGSGAPGRAPEVVAATEQACPGCDATFLAPGNAMHGCRACGVVSFGVDCACGRRARYGWSAHAKAPDGWLRLTCAQVVTPVFACSASCVAVAADALAAAGVLASAPVA